MIKISEDKIMKFKRSKASKRLTKADKRVTKGLRKSASLAEDSIDKFANLLNK